MIVNYYSPHYEDILWAKKGDKNVGFQWLPLKQHLIDVAETMKLLWGTLVKQSSTTTDHKFFEHTE